MPLTLEQYARHLLERADLRWPAAPTPEPIRAKPHVVRLPEVRCVLWTAYGTLLSVPTGDLTFQHDKDFIMDLALEKTIHEFKMWQSMSRKPGQPSEYMRELYKKALLETRAAGSDRHPETPSEKVWENIVQKLLQKEYTWDGGQLGSLNEFTKKVAYFFHASLQGVAAQPGAAAAVREFAGAGVTHGLLADGQAFTPAQVIVSLSAQDGSIDGDAFPESLRVTSWAAKQRKPSEAIFKQASQAATRAGFEPHEVLHVGSSAARDIGPAKKLGFRTALYAGDKASLAATPDQLRDPATKPDLLVTDLAQLPLILS